MNVERKSYKHATDIVSQGQFNAHIDLYKGYVNNVNKRIDDSFLDSYQANGVILHQYYFEQLSVENEPTYEIMNNLFDSSAIIYHKWKSEFIELALKSKEGWVLLVYDTLTKEYKNILLELQDKGIVLGCVPIICLDTFTHAYFLDYLTDKSSYFEKFIKCINWKVIEDRIKNLS